jgi:anhydro-N-acetylmuramic acid kinase
MTDSQRIIGILSGTSVDSIDCVLAEVKGFGPKTEIKVKEFYSKRYPNELKKLILKNSHPKTSNVEDICLLNFLIGKAFAGAISEFLTKKKMNRSSIAFIGSHGQTVYHIPGERAVGGIRSKSTLQLGDPSVIAAMTGITTIGDFRTADMAVGGNGAPFAPYLDYILFGDTKKNIALLNIGGIGNVTLLKKGCRKNEVMAFDTGAGNMMIDALMKKFYKKEYDKNGKVASEGQLNTALFNKLKKRDKYYTDKPPKATGREYYGEDFINFILKNSKGIPKQDIISTVTEFTAFTICYNIMSFLPKGCRSIEELHISGGGAENIFLVQSISSYLPGTKILKLDSKGITAKNKEAVLFAVLANETYNGMTSNLPSVTGAKREVIQGKICLA